MSDAQTRDQSTPPLPPSTLARLDALSKKLATLRDEIGRVIVGQDLVVEEILITLLAGGHALLEGVPGLAKTLLVSTVARTLNLAFSRIQFTPDLMPADITGNQLLQQDPISGERRLVFRPGPVFAGVVLADEINRTPPRTQAALLEAMQEGFVTAGGARHKLPVPFLVLATQNPIEQEGTYPLPEAQRDRFLFHIAVDYPSHREEEEILRRTVGVISSSAGSVLGAEEILELRRLVRALPSPEPLLRFATELVRSTRPDDPLASAGVRRNVAWGAGPRAVQALILASKARALLQGRFAASRADLRSVAIAALRHRVVPSFRAEGDGISALEILGGVLDPAAGRSFRGEEFDARTKELLRL